MYTQTSSSLNSQPATTPNYNNMKLSIGAVKPCSCYKRLVIPTCGATAVSSTTNNVKTTSLAAKNPKLSWNSVEFDYLTHSVKLGKKWMEYQGSNNWEGLLDPLDHNLRTEILRYGQFVEAAYRSFDFDSSSPTFAKCKYDRNSLLTRSGIGETGYRITKNLRATAGVQLPTWVDRAPSWVSTRSSWIGYVAVFQDKEEIARLGRRDVVIAFRGTATCLEWIENLRATLTSLPDDAAMVESGFLSLYTSRTDKCPSLKEMVREEISRIVEIYGDEPLSFTITGHSLGAALATLTAYDINSTSSNAAMVTVISFGGPRVGNKSFRCQLERKGTKILRIVNSDDLVTKVPGFVTDNNDVENNQAVNVAGIPKWLQKRMEDSQWVYADVGKELRLCSKDSPYLSNVNVASCHELSTYLHLVNGFVSSTCRFRTSARRILTSERSLAWGQ